MFARHAVNPTTAPAARSAASSPRLRRAVVAVTAPLRGLVAAVLTLLFLGSTGGSAGTADAASQPPSTPATASAAAASTPPPGGAATSSMPTHAKKPAAKAKVVLLGTAGWRWPDTTLQTSLPRSLAAVGDTAALAPLSIDATACPIDGWLAVSAGRRVSDARDGDTPQAQATTGCRQPAISATKDGGAKVTSWQRYVDRAKNQRRNAHLGLLGDSLKRAGLTTAAVGPGAAVALATSDGAVTKYWPGIDPASDGGVDISDIPPDKVGSGAAKSSQRLAANVKSALAAADVVIVDLGAIRDHSQPATPAGQTPANPDDSQDDPHSQQVNGINDRMSAIMNVLTSDAGDETTLLVMSVADSGDQPHFQLAAIGKPNQKKGGYLTSNTTRTKGLVTTLDIMPTILQDVGAPLPAEIDGAPMHARTDNVSQADRLEHYLGLEEVSTTLPSLLAPFWLSLLTIGFGTWLFLWWLASVHPAPHPSRLRTQRMMNVVALWVASLPVASLLIGLVSWWSLGSAGLAAGFLTALIAAAITGLAYAGPWWRNFPLGPLGIVSLVTVVTIAADALTGGHLGFITPLGGGPLSTGRYYGIGNAVFAIFAPHVLILCLVVALNLTRWRSARVATGALIGIAVIAVLINAAPMAGADFGGTPALMVGLTYFIVTFAQLRWSIRRWLMVIAGSALFVAVICWLDWLRPQQNRTHLGRTFATLVSGDIGDMIVRKSSHVVASVMLTPWTMMGAAFAVVLLIVLVLLPRFSWWPIRVTLEQFPLTRTLVTAWVLLLAIACLINDSSLLIVAIASLAIIPALQFIIVTSVMRAEKRTFDEAAAAVLQAARKKRKRLKGKRSQG